MAGMDNVWTITGCYQPMSIKSKSTQGLFKPFLESWFDGLILHARSNRFLNKKLQNTKECKIGLQTQRTEKILTLN
jgi:hypothetical protein